MNDTAQYQVRDDVDTSEMRAAADPVDERAEEYALDAALERERAFWASPEGVALQLAEHRAERQKWGPVND